MDSKKEDIFGQDFSEKKEAPAAAKEDKSLAKGMDNLLDGIVLILKGFKSILFKSFRINLLILLVLLLLIFFGARYLYQQPPAPVVENVTCPVCDTCPEFNVSLCPKTVEKEVVNKLRYVCPSGEIVDSSEDCVAVYPKITSADVATTDDVTFSIDGLTYEPDENNAIRIKWVNFTIVNKGTARIEPEIQVKVYDVWGSSVAKEAPKFFIPVEETVEPQDWVIKQKRTNLYVPASNQTLRFFLVDTLPSPDLELASIEKSLS